MITNIKAALTKGEIMKILIFILPIMIYQQIEISRYQSKIKYLDSLVVLMDKNSRDYKKYVNDVNGRFYAIKEKIGLKQAKIEYLKTQVQPNIEAALIAKSLKNRLIQMNKDN